MYPSHFNRKFTYLSPGIRAVTKEVDTYTKIKLRRCLSCAFVFFFFLSCSTQINSLAVDSAFCCGDSSVMIPAGIITAKSATDCQRIKK